MANGGYEPLGSAMGNDFLWRFSQGTAAVALQLLQTTFAQVTNPPLDDS